MQNRSPDFLPQINDRQSRVIHFTRACLPPSPFRSLSPAQAPRCAGSAPAAPLSDRPCHPPATQPRSQGAASPPPPQVIPTPQRFAEATPSCGGTAHRAPPAAAQGRSFPRRTPGAAAGRARPHRGGRSLSGARSPAGRRRRRRRPRAALREQRAARRRLPAPPPPSAPGRQLTGARAEQFFLVNFGASRGDVLHKKRASRWGRKEGGRRDPPGGCRHPAQAGSRRRKGAFFHI